MFLRMSCGMELGADRNPLLCGAIVWDDAEIQGSVIKRLGCLSDRFISMVSDLSVIKSPLV